MQYKILAENLPSLQRLINKQYKRAHKLGVEAVALIVGSSSYVTREDGVTVDQFVTIEIEGATPRIAGYEFVATLQHGEAGNILRVVPTWEGKLPEEFRTSDPGRCDHCKQVRRRTDTFIIHHADRGYAQVGRMCLADFVGSDKVHAMASLAEIISLIHEACEAYGESMGSIGGQFLDLEGGIAWAAEAMLRAGWVSRTKAEAQNKEATADLALSAFYLHGKGQVCTPRCYDPCLSHFVPSEHAIKLTRDALEWAPCWIEKELAKEQSSDYLWNLHVVLANSVIPIRSYNLAASILGAYQRHLDRAERIAQETSGSTSEYVGVEGERIVLTLTTKAFRFIDTDYGVSTLITYHDDEGNVIKWFRSSEWEVELEHTDTYEATVKRHVEYQNIKETQVNRMKPYITPEQKKEIAKLRKAAKAEYTRLQAVVDELWTKIPSHVPAYYDPNTASPELAAYNAARDAANAAHTAWKDL